MKEFFKDLIDRMPLLIGVDMIAFIPDDQFNLFLDELVKAGLQDPYSQISDEVKKRIIMDMIYKDESIVKTPYGVRPGINRGVITRWYRQHWELHGARLNEKNETKTNMNASYEDYLLICELNGSSPISKEEYLQPPSPERAAQLMAMFHKQLSDLNTNRGPGIGERMKARYGNSELPGYLTEKKATEQQTFEVEGHVIDASSLEEAQEKFINEKI